VTDAATAFWVPRFGTDSEASRSAQELRQVVRYGRHGLYRRQDDVDSAGYREHKPPPRRVVVGKPDGSHRERDRRSDREESEDC